jgi:EAL domain-containing protein (putative c-di-GMP-specific phosphodiesterase class I)
MAVNLSPRQFRQPDLVQMVARIVGETGQDPRLLDLEITESALMENVEQAVETLLALKALGIRICIDDFGTGYSSLSYLKRFPLDLLKIDRSFIKGLPDDGDDAAIINAILAMARHLHLEVIAEGVETEQQKDYLLFQQCTSMQGYLFSRPLPAEDLASFARQPLAALAKGLQELAPIVVAGRNGGQSSASQSKSCGINPRQ